MNWRRLLFPFSILYDGITRFRNFLFDKKILRSQSFDIPIISIGNLSTGGTGKTPMTEFLIENLSDKNIGVVSRGYGRKTKGLLMADEDSTVESIGDEPFQISRKFPKIKLAVSEKRAVGISALIERFDLDLILLDDAFQHRWVSRNTNLLLTTFSQPFFSDFVLPSGNLREGRKGTNRADIIIVTKCPKDLSLNESKKLSEKINTEKPLFFSNIEYGIPQNLLGETLSNEAQKINLLTGIATTESLELYLKKKYEIMEHFNFSDHHFFAEKELNPILKNSQFPIITTEKDFVRFSGKLNQSALRNIYYLPIKINILFNKKGQFLNQIFPPL